MISDDAPDPRNGKIIQCRVLAPDPLGPVGRFVSGALARGTLSLCGWSPSPPPVPNFRRPSTARVRQSPSATALLSFFCPACSSLLLAGGSSLSPALLFYAPRRRPTFALRVACVPSSWENRDDFSPLLPPPALSPPVFFSLMCPCALSAARCTWVAPECALLRPLVNPLR